MVIVDQLLKGTAQTLSSHETFSLFGGVSLAQVMNAHIIGGIDLGLGHWDNRIALFFDWLLSLLCLWGMILWRNIFPLRGLFLTFILVALFSSCIDRFFYGYTLDYFLLGQTYAFSIADLSLSFGLLGMGPFLIRELGKKKK